MMNLIFLALSICVHANTQETYIGEAKRDGQVIYTEHHTFTTGADGKVISAKTEYKDPKGQVIATLSNDLTVNLTSPAHVFEDLRFKNRHGVRLGQDKIVMFSQDEGEAEVTKTVKENAKKSRTVFGGQGIHYFLRDNFQKVMDSKKLPIVFLIPGSLDQYNFELHFISRDGDLGKYEIEFDNFFLKLFAPKLEMTYDQKLKRLVKYKGLSNLLDAKRKNQSVEITYTYPN